MIHVKRNEISWFIKKRIIITKMYIYTVLATAFLFLFNTGVLAQSGIISLETQVLNYKGQYLNMSTTQGTIKVFPDKKHTGSRWRIVEDGGHSYLQTQGAGKFLGNYLALKADGSKVYMVNNRSKAAQWKFIPIGGMTVLENVATRRFLTVSSKTGKVWSTADLNHSGTKWVIR